MKKDYLPVSDAAAHLEEAVFVEAHWTQVWDEAKGGRTPRAAIERYEEFAIMDAYLSRLPGNSRLLDGGCGLGEWTVSYASRGFDVVGMDLSRATIQRLRTQFPTHRFVVGDVRQTTFEDASFDAYFSWGTFEHFEEGPGACFREARRILKPGGYLFVSVPFQNARHIRRDARPLWVWDEHFERARGYPNPMRFYQWRLTKEELRRELEIHGFATLRIEAIHNDTGLHRAVKHDLRLEPGSLAYRVAYRLLYPLVPKDYVAHMVMGVGQKR